MTRPHNAPPARLGGSSAPRPRVARSSETPLSTPAPGVSAQPRRVARLSRRTMLRGALGTLISLPLLECMLDDHGVAHADGTSLPCRYFLQQCPTSLVTSGSREEGMTPTRTGFGYDVRPVLQPLADHGVTSDVSVVSGLFVAPLDAPGGYNVDYHGQATYAILTGKRSGFDGVTWRPQGWSSDQIVARGLGAPTRFPSLYFQLDPQAGGTAISYEETEGFSDEPPIVYRGITAQSSPALAYRSLFTGFVPPSGMPDPEAELERRLRVSSLSYARDRIAALSSRVSAADRRTLDEHFTRVRELETRIANTSVGVVGAACADPGLPGVDPADVTTDVPDQDARAALWVDLIEMAFACDMTRVIAFGGSSVLTGAGMRHSRWADIGGLHGELQHTASQADLDAANAFFVDIYARVIARMKASTEGEATVLDRTAALFVMEGGKGLTNDPMRSGDGGGDPNHSVDNYVMLVGGRAGGLRSGQHVSLAGRDLHPAAVMNTAMRAVGVPQDLGDITDRVDELLTG
jgi:hypothetical protein